MTILAETPLKKGARGHALALLYGLSALLILSDASAQDNPGWHAFPYRCKEGETVFEAMKIIQDCEWSPNFTGWNGKFTVHNNQKIKNAVVSPCPWANGGSFQVEVEDLGTVTVTAAKSDDAWDAHYTGFDRVSGSTFTQNCYGYALALGYNVLDFEVIKDNDLDSFTTPECIVGAIIKKDFDHSIKLTYCCNAPYGPYTIGTTHEKNSTSGVYKATYYCPGGGDPGNKHLSGTRYRRKP